MHWELFDRMVMPILMYAAEIWGFNVNPCLEQVQISYCKFVLRVPTSTSNAAVLGECGRSPLAVKCTLKVINFWLKLLNMDVNRLPKSCYEMLFNLDKIGRKTWASEVKNILYKFGYGIVWFEQGVGDSAVFVRAFEQRVTDCYTQSWHSDCMKNNKLNMYTNIKSLLEPEKYLTCVTNTKFKSSLARFRCSSHKLAIETGRWTNTEAAERICILCANHGEVFIESEYHFLLVCLTYRELRDKFIPKYYHIHPDNAKFISLLKSDNEKVVTNLAKYVHFASKLREKIITV